MRWVAVWLTMGAVMAAAPAGAGTHDTGGCRDRGATVLANGVARVFEDDGLRYGCVYRGDGPPRRLAVAGSLRFVRLVGGLVSYADVSCTADGCSYDARTVNLRTGRRTRRFRALGRPRSTALGRNGSFAVITQSNSDERAYMVHAVRNDGPVLLDVGPEIEPRSLALGGGRVYWTVAGGPRSAQLR
jgi:hypothetical protein